MPCVLYCGGDVGLVEAWFSGLDDDSYAQVIAVLEVLAERGQQLGRPLVETVARSRHRNMKELRPGSNGKSELRVLFAFDPHCQTILLVAGDKAGKLVKVAREEHSNRR